MNPFQSAQPGIYVIRNTVNGRVYVGTALDVDQAVRLRQQHLGKRQVDNFALLADVQRYGREAFEISVVERLDDPSQLEQKAELLAQQLQAYQGYNLRSIGRSRRQNRGLKSTYHHGFDPVQQARQRRARGNALAAQFRARASVTKEVPA